MNRYELEERLIDFSVVIIKMTKTVKKDFAGTHLSTQIIRSATSVALNYGEAQSAASKRDFIHKMSICLKELRETFVNLKILEKANLIESNIEKIKGENNELISIFVKSIKTSRNIS